MTITENPHSDSDAGELRALQRRAYAEGAQPLSDAERVRLIDLQDRARLLRASDAAARRDVSQVREAPEVRDVNEVPDVPEVREPGHRPSGADARAVTARTAGTGESAAVSEPAEPISRLRGATRAVAAWVGAHTRWSVVIGAVTAVLIAILAANAVISHPSSVLVRSGVSDPADAAMLDEEAYPYFGIGEGAWTSYDPFGGLVVFEAPGIDGKRCLIGAITGEGGPPSVWGISCVPATLDPTLDVPVGWVTPGEVPADPRVDIRFVLRAEAVEVWLSDVPEGASTP